MFGTLLANNAFAHAMSEADRVRALEAGIWEYIELGAKHMVTGYDHLLFLLGVVFFLTRFKDIIKLITAFTLGHSITLVFATLYHIQANYFLIDAVIALTVMYKGFENLDGFKKYLDVKAPNLLFMVFAFGLIHGFGLSTRLQMLPLPEEGLVVRILAFNVGVELGQIVALSIMLVLLSAWRKTLLFKKFSNAINSLLIFIGFLLFLLQMHGYQHVVNAEEFPLNQHDHTHIHEDWKYEKAHKYGIEHSHEGDVSTNKQGGHSHSHDGNGDKYNHKHKKQHKHEGEQGKHSHKHNNAKDGSKMHKHGNGEPHSH